MRMIKSKGWVTNREIETIRRKIENEGRDEVNQDTMQESDNIVDINDENVDINHADSANEKPIRIIENDLSNSERDRHLRLGEALEGDDFGKTEVKLKYGEKVKIKEEVIKMNKVLKREIHRLYTLQKRHASSNKNRRRRRRRHEEIKYKEEKEPLWKRRILRDVSRVRKDLSRIEAWFAEDGKRTKKTERKKKKKKRKTGRLKVWAEKERVYIGNGRTETENNCKSH